MVEMKQLINLGSRKDEQLQQCQNLEFILQGLTQNLSLSSLTIANQRRGANVEENAIF